MAVRVLCKCFFVYKMLSPLFTRIWVFQLQLLPEAPLAQRLEAKPEKVKVSALLQPLWQLLLSGNASELLVSDISTSLRGLC